MKKAFTLAEIMIVLTVIGVLTAILLPVAFQAAPDENAMKFKKANSTFGTMIRELVNSDRYFADGDLGMKSGGGAGAAGSLLKGSNDVEKQYFCQSLADIMSTKKVNCSTGAGNGTKYVSSVTGTNQVPNVSTVKSKVDEICAATQIEEIVSSDNITWYQASPATPFGAVEGTGANEKRYFAPPNTAPSKPEYTDKFGFDTNYKVFCIDVDGVNNGEAPFGYGVRADGKIIPGNKADLWVKKAVQQES